MHFHTTFKNEPFELKLEEKEKKKSAEKHQQG